MPKRTCHDCRHWKSSPDSQGERLGMCSKPALSTGFTGWQQTHATDSCDDWTQLAWFEGRDGRMHVDRRSTARTRVDYPARLQTAGGDWSGRLTDMSETGARLLVRDPPKKGVHALLKCGGNEIFCKIAWSAGEACGLAFDRPISSSLVFEISGKVEVAPQNIANPNRIPAGRKRARPELSNPGQARILSPGDDIASPENVVSLDERRPRLPEPSGPEGDPAIPAAASFESRDESGYIKFYPFRAMANP